MIKRSEIPIVITIDSIESCHSSVEWIPAELPDNVKLIFTLSTGDEQSECLLTGLKNMVQENLVCLTSFSNEQWNEIINSGGSDFCAANGALQLPAEWIDTPDKTPIHAKVSLVLFKLNYIKLTICNTFEQLPPYCPKKFNSS